MEISKEYYKVICKETNSSHEKSLEKNLDLNEANKIYEEYINKNYFSVIIQRNIVLKEDIKSYCKCEHKNTDTFGDIFGGTETYTQCSDCGMFLNKESNYKRRK